MSNSHFAFTPGCRNVGTLIPEGMCVTNERTTLFSCGNDEQSAIQCDIVCQCELNTLKDCVIPLWQDLKSVHIFDTIRSLELHKCKGTLQFRTCMRFPPMSCWWLSRFTSQLSNARCFKTRSVWNMTNIFQLQNYVFPWRPKDISVVLSTELRRSIKAVWRVSSSYQFPLYYLF